MLAALPTGRTLPPAGWERRHRWMVNLLRLHVPVLAVVAMLNTGVNVHAAAETAPVALLALIAGTSRGGQRTRSLLVALGLLTASAMLVHVMNGMIEAHFHFFVIIAVLTLYEDWFLFLAAVAYVLLHHGVIGILATDSVYAHGGAPLKWAGIHALFVAAAGAANVLAWRLNEDVRAEQRRTEEALRELALHDPLTGLGNRRLLTDRLEEALALPEEGTLAVFLLDLDSFKLVNDSHGHGAGDAVLAEVANRLRATVRDADTLTRVGGDEFVLVCPGLAGEAAAHELAARLVNAVGRSVEVDGISVHSTCSVGFALSDGPGADADDLLQQADLALHAAKDTGPAQFEHGTGEMLKRERGRRELSEQLERAVQLEQFTLYYQPIVDLRTGAVMATEALVRWDDPVRGTVMPGDFLPLAESSGLIVPLGRWVLAEACRQAAEWNETYMDRAPMRMFVNASAREFGEADFADNVESTVRQAGIEPSQLTIEVTEGMMMQDEDLAEVAFRLSAFGAQVALDDFGAAYSSLGRLASLPLDVVKLDREFVSGRARSGVVVRAVGHMAREMGLKPVAEGVETRDQVAVAIDAGYDVAQGFYFAPPLALHELTPLLSQERPFAAHLPALSAH